MVRDKNALRTFSRGGYINRVHKTAKRKKNCFSASKTGDAYLLDAVHIKDIDTTDRILQCAFS